MKDIDVRFDLDSRKQLNALENLLKSNNFHFPITPSFFEPKFSSFLNLLGKMTGSVKRKFFSLLNRKRYDEVNTHTVIFFQIIT